ncbi:MAG TPA: hypothetical protein PLA50_20635, partial [Bacteroidia bacterium]|nr:hypothetical protein [Bacteroidia bacterium]
MNAPLPRKRGFPIRWLVCAVAALALLLAGLYFGSSSPESRALGRTVEAWRRTVERGGGFEVRASLVETGRLPQDLAGMPVSASWEPPGRLRVEATVKGEAVVAVRDGGSVWVHLPGKRFALIGDESVPRFTGYPDSVERVELPDWSFPLSAWQVRLLPMLLEVQENEGGEGRRIVPSRLGRALLDLPEFVLEWRPLEDGLGDL